MKSGSGVFCREVYTRPQMEPAVLLSDANSDGRRHIVGTVE
jgi:hypothetical protein